MRPAADGEKNALVAWGFGPDGLQPLAGEKCLKKFVSGVGEVGAAILPASLRVLERCKIATDHLLRRVGKWWPEHETAKFSIQEASLMTGNRDSWDESHSRGSGVKWEKNERTSGRGAVGKTVNRPSQFTFPNTKFKHSQLTYSNEIVVANSCLILLLLAQESIVAVMWCKSSMTEDIYRCWYWSSSCDHRLHF